VPGAHGIWFDRVCFASDYFILAHPVAAVQTNRVFPLPPLVFEKRPPKAGHPLPMVGARGVAEAVAEECALFDG